MSKPSKLAMEIAGKIYDEHVVGRWPGIEKLARTIDRCLPPQPFPKPSELEPGTFYVISLTYSVRLRMAHSVLREGDFAEISLGTADEAEVIGTAETAREARELAERLRNEAVK